MPKFRKKPVEIEAFQWRQHVAWPEWFAIAVGEGRASVQKLDGKHFAKIDTLEGNMTAMPDDWIIQGVKGEIYPCKPDIFAATYDEVITRVERPSIDELEKMLQEPDRKVNINPDGSVTAELIV